MRCSVDDFECVPGRLRKGMCERHYRRMKATGTTVAPDLTPTLTRYVVDARTQCWVYTGPLYKNGYGKLSRAEHGTRLAHRASFIEHRPGVDITGLDLDHLCRHHECMNPDHLEPVSRSVNLERGFDIRNQGLCRNRLHDMTVANTLVTPTGRVCRECKRAKDRRSGATYRARRNK